MTGRLAIVLLTTITALAGCASPEAQAPAARPMVARFYLETRPGEMAVTVQLPQSGVQVGVAPKPVFSEYDIANAELARVELGLCVLVQFSPAAARDLYRLSVPAQGRRLVFSLDGACLGVHRIDHALADGIVPIFLEVPDGQLPVIVQKLKLAAVAATRDAGKTANK